LFSKGCNRQDEKKIKKGLHEKNQALKSSTYEHTHIIKKDHLQGSSHLHPHPIPPIKDALPRIQPTGSLLQGWSFTEKNQKIRLLQVLRTQGSLCFP
jgi:hypothetical protein